MTEGADAIGNKGSLSVVIVGGGIAGISAARHLIKNGIQQVKILEAMNRLGGRILTVNGEAGKIDFGAQYIHGGDENPLYQMAVKHDLIDRSSKTTKGSGTSSFYGNEFYKENGSRIPKEIVRDVNEFLESVHEECNGIEENTNCHESMGHCFERRFEEYLGSRDDTEEDVDIKKGLFDWRIRWEIHDNGCRSLFDVASPARYQNYNGSYFTEVKNGFQSVLSILLRDIPSECIRTETPVTKIDWESSGICNDRIGSKQCMIETKHGEYIYCDYVIVTVPLGFLQSNTEKLFQPPLPSRKKAAILRSGFGNLVKVFLTWTTPFWDKSFEGIQFVWTSNKDVIDKQPASILTKKNGDPWYRDFDGFHVLRDNPSTLLGWIGGEGGCLSECLAEGEILETCYLLLKKFAPDMNIPKPCKMQRSQWQSLEYIRGSYSYVSIYSEPNDFEELTKPLPSKQNPVLLFAGEAMSYHHYSTTHGAYESGIDAANLVLQNATQFLNI
ncbi:spermine oxidase-like [Saccostrea echinata]|uniref:spermine oxidase-like n=1 Tax=Saccostrea echinata TaxID=191078 RepID=UPI002A8060DC|nr:spermine oxidase-like [Saccostrea echinata]